MSEQEPVADKLDRLLWEFIDLQAMHPEHKPDQRTWPHLLVYVPKPKPVAWMYICDGDEAHPVLVHAQKDWTKASWWHEVPLYTTPQQRTWVGLTYEDMVSLQKDLHDSKGEIVLPTTFAKAIEAKLKEKNT